MLILRLAWRLTLIVGGLTLGLCWVILSAAAQAGRVRVKVGPAVTPSR